MPTGQVTEEQLRFKEAMARFASGVTIVTTTDDAGQSWGFTASSFCSLSLQPPLVLVCLDRSADCYPVFCARPRFLVNILSTQHRELALRFATKGGDKFAAQPFVGHDGDGLPALPDAVATVSCRLRDCHDGGDHVILVGEADGADVTDGAPLVHAGRGFFSLDELHGTGR